MALCKDKRMNRLPGGCTHVGGDLASAMEECRKTFHSLFGRWGYTPFLPSGLQLLESTWDRLPVAFRQKLIALSSPYGEPCCLRGDITLAAVAHLASHHTPTDRPLRLCYSDRVYVRGERPRQSMESFQIGAELVGGEWPGADVEMLLLLLRFLEEIGLDESVLVLGDAAFIDRALSGVDGAIAGRIVESLGRRSLVDYRRILGENEFFTRQRAILEMMPRLQGGSEVIEEASRLLEDDTPLISLRSIVATLKSLGCGDRVTVDLSLVRELGYYSGPLFEVYSGSYGQPVGGGGRYDRLLSLCGLGGQATGFGLDLQQIASLSKFKSSPSSVMAWSADLSPDEALRRADRLAATEDRLEMSWGLDRDSSIKSAVNKGCSCWIDLSDGSKIELDQERRNSTYIGKGSFSC